MSGNTVRKKKKEQSPLQIAMSLSHPGSSALIWVEKNGEANEKKCDYYMKACGERKKKKKKKNGARGKKKGRSDTEKLIFVIQGTRKTGSKVYGVTCRLR